MKNFHQIDFQMKSYLITDPAYYTDLPSFQRYLETIFSRHTPDFVCFRDKINQDIYPYAKRFIEITAAANITQTLINRDIVLARKLGFWGLHLTSQQQDQIASVSKNFFTLISTHTLQEALDAERRGADAVTISPIFASPGKGEGKGVELLCDVTRQLQTTKVFALGGIVSQKEIALIATCQPYGFASIRYFI